MPKEFITERDIEDMVRRGVMTLEVNDNVVLTELAYEKAGKLGLKLVRDKPENPPSAPVRPYIIQQAPVQPPPAPAPQPAPASELEQRIRAAVTARLGSQVDVTLLDVIIKRVLASTGVK
jgi:hypothetical protein